MLPLRLEVKTSFHDVRSNKMDSNNASTTTTTGNNNNKNDNDGDSDKTTPTATTVLAACSALVHTLYNACPRPPQRPLVERRCI
jgi:hypothetical protein